MLLAIGTILVIDKGFTEDSDKYKSKVVDLEENSILIDYPTHTETGKTAFFMDGTELFISFTDQSKISYAFKTAVSGRIMKGIPMLKLSYPGDDRLIKIQRRQFVRVETSLDVAVTKEEKTVQLVTEDISAGGIALNMSTNTWLETNDSVHLLIVLPFKNAETEYIRTTGQIVRIWEKAGRKIASIQFEKLQENDRQCIIRFCFERQLQLRKK